MNSAYSQIRMIRKIAFFVTIIITSGCKKFITIPPPVNSLTSGNVYSNDATAASVLTNIYLSMTKGGSLYIGSTGLSVFLGCSADELTVFDVNNDPNEIAFYYKNALNSRIQTSLWNFTYPLIFDTNVAIEGLSGDSKLSPTVKQQLTGEALFMRGAFYFYLVNLYGDVPLVLNTDYKVNASLARTPKSQVYQQIISDLKAAESLLSANYVAGDAQTSTTERLRPTKWAAAAFLARVYLYYGDLTKDASNYVNSETEASLVISNNNLFALDSLNDVFLKNSTESIWQLQPVYNGTYSNSLDGVVFVLPATGPNTNDYPVYLSNQLLNAFESGDKRRVKWVNSIMVGSDIYYYPYKYKIGAVDTSTREYSTVLRLGEQYLIRAEARAKQNKLSDAISDLNIIRKRAGLSGTSASTQSTILSAIMHERQVELFSEWGHRWLDLKRTNTVDQIMNIVSPQKGGTWNTNWALYPVPLSELQTDPKLVQNPGY